MERSHEGINPALDQHLRGQFDERDTALRVAWRSRTELSTHYQRQTETLDQMLLEQGDVKTQRDRLGALDQLLVDLIMLQYEAANPQDAEVDAYFEQQQQGLVQERLRWLNRFIMEAPAEAIHERYLTARTLVDRFPDQLSAPLAEELALLREFAVDLLPGANHETVERRPVTAARLDEDRSQGELPMHYENLERFAQQLVELLPPQGEPVLSEQARHHLMRFVRQQARLAKTDNAPSDQAIATQMSEVIPRFRQQLNDRLEPSDRVEQVMKFVEALRLQEEQRPGFLDQAPALDQPEAVKAYLATVLEAVHRIESDGMGADPVERDVALYAYEQFVLGLDRLFSPEAIQELMESLEGQTSPRLGYLEMGRMLESLEHQVAEMQLLRQSVHHITRRLEHYVRVLDQRARYRAQKRIVQEHGPSMGLSEESLALHAEPEQLEQIHAQVDRFSEEHVENRRHRVEEDPLAPEERRLHLWYTAEHSHERGQQREQVLQVLRTENSDAVIEQGIELSKLLELLPDGLTDIQPVLAQALQQWGEVHRVDRVGESYLVRVANPQLGMMDVVIDTEARLAQITNQMPEELQAQLMVLSRENLSAAAEVTAAFNQAFLLSCQFSELLLSADPALEADLVWLAECFSRGYVEEVRDTQDEDDEELLGLLLDDEQLTSLERLQRLIDQLTAQIQAFEQSRQSDALDELLLDDSDDLDANASDDLVDLLTANAETPHRFELHGEVIELDANQIKAMVDYIRQSVIGDRWGFQWNELSTEHRRDLLQPIVERWLERVTGRMPNTPEPIDDSVGLVEEFEEIETNQQWLWQVAAKAFPKTYHDSPDNFHGEKEGKPAPECFFREVATKVRFHRWLDEVPQIKALLEAQGETPNWRQQWAVYEAAIVAATNEELTKYEAGAESGRLEQENLESLFQQALARESQASEQLEEARDAVSAQQARLEGAQQSLARLEVQIQGVKNDNSLDRAHKRSRLVLLRGQGKRLKQRIKQFKKTLKALNRKLEEAGDVHREHASLRRRAEQDRNAGLERAGSAAVGEHVVDKHKSPAYFEARFRRQLEIAFLHHLQMREMTPFLAEEGAQLNDPVRERLIVVALQRMPEEIRATLAAYREAKRIGNVTPTPYASLRQQMLAHYPELSWLSEDPNDSRHDFAEVVRLASELYERQDDQSPDAVDLTDPPAPPSASDSVEQVRELTGELNAQLPQLFEASTLTQLDGVAAEIRELLDNPAGWVDHLQAWAERQSAHLQNPQIRVDRQANGDFRLVEDGLILGQPYHNEHTLSSQEARRIVLGQMEDHVYETVYHVAPTAYSRRLDSVSDQAMSDQIKDAYTQHLGEPMVQNDYWEHYWGVAGVPYLRGEDVDARFYLNPRSLEAPGVLKRIFEAVAQYNTQAENGQTIALATKIRNRELMSSVAESRDNVGQHHRPDRIVLYCSETAIEPLMEIIRQVHGETSALNPEAFSSRRPLFTGAVRSAENSVVMLNGVGFAQEPESNKHSFGTLISHALTETLAEMATSNPPEAVSAEAIRQHVGRKLLETGMDPNRPYLMRRQSSGAINEAVRDYLEANLDRYWSPSPQPA